MKTIFYKTYFLVLLLLLLCNTTFAQWQKVLDMDSFTRSRPASFVIGDTAYLANGDPGFFVYAADLHGYTQNSNTWTTLRPFPGGGGDWGIRFQIGDTAYIGGGANPGWQNSFYKYTPSQGWTSLGTTPHAMSMTSNMSFSVGNYGYVGGGDWTGTPIDSFWQYDPIANTFTTETPVPGGPRQSGVAFSAKGYGYIGLGSAGGSGITFKDMYRYDPGTNTWDTMAPLPANTGFSDAGFFVLCGKLIVTMGDTVQTGTSTTPQTWMYDPYNGPKGTWSRLPDYPGLMPSYAPGAFTMGDTGFIYGGWNQTIYADRAEMYRFLPTRALMNMLASPLDTSVCTGNPVTLKANSSAYYLWNNNDTTANITVSPTKDTTYIVTETSGGCVYLDTINVAVSPGPTVSITPNPASVCNGQTITLVASGGTNYQWVSTSDTTDSLSVKPTTDTTYELLVSTGSCTTDTLIPVNVNMPPPLPSQNQANCFGASIVLTVPASGSNYVWGPDSTLNTYTGDTVVASPSSDIVYTVTGIDSLGCTVTANDTINVVPSPNKPSITISVTGDSLISSAGSYNQWNFNGQPIPDSMRNVLVITGHARGYYTVTVTNPANGCSTTSDSTSGINQLSLISSQLSIYPNPFNNNIYIKVSSSALNVNEWSLQVTDVLGRTIYTRSSLSYSNEVDLSALPNGMYFISVTSKTATAVFPLVKQN